MKHSFKQNSSLNSNRKRSQTILIGIVSFLVLTFLEVFLLSAVSLIPRSAIRKHTQESAEYLLEKPVFYRVVKQDPASNIDHYADAILLNILYHFDSAHPVTSPLTASYYYTETHNENENLYTAVTSNVTPTYDYFRLLAWFNYFHTSIANDIKHPADLYLFCHYTGNTICCFIYAADEIRTHILCPGYVRCAFVGIVLVYTYESRIHLVLSDHVYCKHPYDILLPKETGGIRAVLPACREYHRIF